MNTIQEDPEAHQLLADFDSDYFTDWRVVWQYVDSAEQAHNLQWRVVSAIEEHLDGKKPMDQKVLDQMGMSWAFNYTYYQATGQIEGAVSEFVSKINNAVSLGYPEFRNSNEDDVKDEVLAFLADPNLRGVVSMVIGCAFAEAMDREGGLSTFLNKTEYLSYTFGYCPVAFVTGDWKGIPIHIKHIASRPGAEIEDLSEWVVFKVEQAKWLMRNYIRVRNLDISRRENGMELRSNWDLRAMEKVLAKLYKGKIEDAENGRERTAETWEDVYPTYQDSPSWFLSNCSDVKIAKVFYQEADDSITELYIPWGEDWCKPGNKQINQAASQTPLILFKKKHRNGTIPRDLLDFIRDSGFTTSGEISKMRGVGRMAVENSTRYNRMRNTVHNKSLFAGAPWFETNQTQGKEKFKVTFSQGFVMMPEGSNFVEKQPTFQIAEHIGLLGFEEREFNSNTKQFTARATDGLSSRPTSDEVRLAQQEAGRSRMAKDTVKINDYSRIFGQFIKRMGTMEFSKSNPSNRAHRLFFDLILRQLPDQVKTDEDVRKILKCVDSYCISMVLGDVQALTLALNMSETPFGRNRARRMMLIASGMPRREVDLQVPIFVDKYRSFQDDRIAAIENDMFWTTNEVIFQETDDDIIHLQSHDKKMKQVFDGARKGSLDIVAAYKYTLNLFSHMNLHVESMVSDPTLENKSKEWIAILKENKRTIDQMAFNADKAMKEREEAQMAQSQISPKDAAKIRSEQAQTVANQQRKDWQAQDKSRQQDEKQSMQHEERLAKIESDHQLDVYEASLKSTAKQ